MKIKILLIILLLLVGCNKEQDAEIDSIPSYKLNDYDILFPYNINNSRYWYSNFLTKNDSISMVKSLQDYSKKIFPTSDNVMGGSSILSYDEIQMLQRRNSKEYPYALNLSSGSYEIIPGKFIDSPYVIYGVYELNFFDKSDVNILTGLSLSVMSDFKQFEDNTESSIAFVENVSKRLVDYLKNEKNIDDNVDINIMFYQIEDDFSYVPGNFKYQYILSDNNISVNEINEKWIMVPSEELKNIDSQVYNDFNSIKSQIINFIPENVAIIGKSKFIDDNLHEMHLEIKMQAKTYNELYAMSQFLLEAVSILKNESALINIKIKQHEVVSFIINKDYESQEFIVVDLN